MSICMHPQWTWLISAMPSPSTHTPAQSVKHTVTMHATRVLLHVCAFLDLTACCCLCLLFVLQICVEYSNGPDTGGAQLLSDVDLPIAIVGDGRLESITSKLNVIGTFEAIVWFCPFMFDFTFAWKFLCWQLKRGHFVWWLAICCFLA